MRHRQTGTTLVEMMGTLIIIGILLTIASVGLDRLANTRTASEANRLHLDIEFARSEAIKWGELATLCIADDIASCDPASPSTCRCRPGAGARAYHDGWLIFIDADRDHEFDDEEDLLLRVGLPAAPGIQMNANDALRAALSLNAGGELADSTSQGEIYVCHEGVSTTDLPGRRLVLHMSGRAVVQKMAGGTSCNAGGDDDDDDDDDDD